jgi:hypothetical protein
MPQRTAPQPPVRRDKLATASVNLAIEKESSIETAFPNPIPIEQIVGMRAALLVAPILDRARQSNASLGGLTIGKPSMGRALCYVGPLPTGVDKEVRNILQTWAFQVSAVRDASKLNVYRTQTGKGRFIHRVKGLPPPHYASARPVATNCTANAKMEPAVAAAFQLFGLSSDAHPEVVKAAYRTLAGHYHPDRQKNRDNPLAAESANQAFADLTAAYEIILVYLKGKK